MRLLKRINEQSRYIEFEYTDTYTLWLIEEPKGTAYSLDLWKIY